ncbi:hypothetical protein QBC47DRAFT_406030 [Echria macrotheca]|uniref:DUF6594 domain-containing protein n=1 Tax=Echria macrotheca TaxID=438768 RepID=A0AAJ0B436_9PEZI|nr:hypothetical protein QBC47DRAFT_406030 [Echria macrotheca]
MSTPDTIELATISDGSEQQQMPPQPRSLPGPDESAHGLAGDGLSLHSWEAALQGNKCQIVQSVSPRWSKLSWAYRLLRVPFPNPEQCGYDISIIEMQRTYVNALRAELVDLGIQLRWPDDLPKTTSRLSKTLEKYVQAIRDLEYMEPPFLRKPSNFKVAYERGFDRGLLRNAMERARNTRPPANRDTNDGAAPFVLSRFMRDTGPWENLPANAEIKSFVHSEPGSTFGLIFGVCGICALLAPMWTLAFTIDLSLQLSITTIYICAFCFALTFFLDKPEHILGGSLAYAAVLMVFVGATMADPNKSGDA